MAYGPRRLPAESPSRFRGTHSLNNSARTGSGLNLSLRSTGGRDGRGVGPRQRTPAREPSPPKLPSVSDLCDRILLELRMHRGPGALQAREKLLKLVHGYINVHGPQMIQKSNGLDGVVADDAGSTVASTRDAATPASATIAATQNLRSQLADVEIQLALSEQKTAEVRCDLADARVIVKKTEEKLRATEDRYRKAELRALRAEGRLKDSAENWDLRFTEDTGVPRRIRDKARAQRIVALGKDININIEHGRQRSPASRSASPRASPRGSPLRLTSPLRSTKLMDFVLDEIEDGAVDLEMWKRVSAAVNALEACATDYRAGKEEEMELRKIKFNRLKDEAVEESARMPGRPGHWRVEVVRHSTEGMMLGYQAMSLDPWALDADKLKAPKRDGKVLKEQVAGNVKFSDENLPEKNQANKFDKEFREMQQKARARAQDKLLNEAKQELQKLKMEARVPGDEKSEQMAKKFREYADKELALQMFFHWNRTAFTHKAAHERDKAKAKFDEEMHQLKHTHREKGDKTAEAMAEKFRARHLDALQAQCYAQWHRLAIKNAAERHKRMTVEAHSNELENLKTQHRQKGDATAEQMAETFRRQRLLEIANDCIDAWRLHARETIANRTQKQSKEAHAAEMDRLKNTQRERGDKTAEQMAEQFRKQKLDDIVREFVTSWYNFTRNVTGERFRRQQTQMHEEEVQTLKEKHREKGDQTAEQLANKFREKMKIETMLFTLTSWFKSTKEQQNRNTKKQYEEEMESLKAVHREKGDKTAEKMADNYQETRMLKLCHRCLISWFKDMGRKKHQQEKRQMTQKFDNEMETLKRKEREKGDATAEQMAKKFRKKLEAFLLQKCLHGWLHKALQESGKRKQEQIYAESEKELNDLKAKSRKKGDATAEQIATNFRKKIERDLLHTAIVTMHEFTLKEVASRKQREQEQEFEEEMRQFANEQRELGGQKAEAMAKQFRDRHNHEVLQFLTSFWHKQALLGKEDREKAEMTQNFDRELEELKKSNRKAGDQKAELMAVQFRKKMNSKTKHMVLLKWHKLSDSGKNEREKKEKQDAHNKELKELKKQHDQEIEKGGEAAQKMAASYHQKVLQHLAQRVMGAWRQYTLVEAANTAQETQRKEYEDNMEKLKHQNRQKGDATAQAMADAQYKKHYRMLIQQIVAEWHKFQMQQDAGREQEKVTAKYEDEIEQMKKQRKGRDEKMANDMANKFHKQHMFRLMVVAMQEWKVWADTQEKNRKEVELRREHEAEITAHRRRFDAHNDLLAKVLVRDKMVFAGTVAFFAWKGQMVLTKTTTNLNNLRREEHQMYEERVEAMKIQYDEKALQTREKLLEKVMFAEGLMLKQRCFCALVNLKDMEIKDKSIVRLQLYQEDQFAALVKAQADARHKIMEHMSKGTVKNVERLIYQRILVEWSYCIQLYTKIRVATLDQMQAVQEAKELKEKQWAREELRVQRQGAILEAQSIRRLKLLIVKYWRDDARTELRIAKYKKDVERIEMETKNFRLRLMSDAADAMAKLQFALDDSNYRRMIQKIFDYWFRLQVVEKIQQARRDEYRALHDGHQEQLLQLDAKFLKLQYWPRDWIAKFGEIRAREMDELMFFSRWRQLSNSLQKEQARETHRETIIKMEDDYKVEIRNLKASGKLTRMAIGEKLVTVIESLVDHWFELQCLAAWKQSGMMKKKMVQQRIAEVQHHDRFRAGWVVVWCVKIFQDWHNPALVKMCIGYWLYEVLETKGSKDLKRQQKLHELELERYASRETWLVDRKHDTIERLLDKDLVALTNRLVLLWHEFTQMIKSELKEAKMKELHQNQMDALKETDRIIRLRVTEGLGATVVRLTETLYAGRIFGVWLQFRNDEVRTRTEQQQAAATEARFEEAERKFRKEKRTQGMIAGDHVGEKLNASYEELLMCMALFTWRATKDAALDKKRAQASERAMTYQYKTDLQLLSAKKDKSDGRSRMLENAMIVYADTIATGRRVVRAVVCYMVWKSDFLKISAEKQVKKESAKVTEKGERELKELREKELASHHKAMDEISHSLYREKYKVSGVRSLAGWRRVVVRQKEVEHYQKLEELKLKEKFEQETAAEKMKKSQDKLKQQLSWARSYLVDRWTECNLRCAVLVSYLQWERQVAIGSMAADCRVALNDKDKQLYVEAKARRIADQKMKVMAKQLNPPKREPYDPENDILGTLKGQKIAEALIRIVNRSLANGLISLFEFDGPSDYAPPGFHEALESAKSRGLRGRAAKAQAALERENEIMTHIAALEHHGAQKQHDLIELEKDLAAREREIGLLRQELENTRGKLALALRGDPEAAFMQLTPRPGDITSPRIPTPHSPKSPQRDAFRDLPPLLFGTSTSPKSSSSPKTTKIPDISAQVAEDDGGWTGVNSTLARLSRARQVIRGHLPEDQSPDGDTQGQRFSRKATVVQQAQLESQLLELQEYLNRVKQDLPKT